MVLRIPFLLFAHKDFSDYVAMSGLCPVDRFSSPWKRPGTIVGRAARTIIIFQIHFLYANRGDSMRKMSYRDGV